MTDVRQLIKDSPEHAIGALLAIYRLQTPDEKNIQFTVHQNDVGFNGADANPMSSIAQQFLERGTLTERQIAFVQRTVGKYHGQLEAYGYDPVKVETRKPKPEIQAIMSVDVAEGESFSIKFEFPRGDSRFNETLAKVKSLSMRRWNPTEKTWTAPASYKTADRLKAWGFKFSKAAKVLANPQAEEAPIDESLLDERLFPYQKTGVQWLQSRDGNALIGDDQGLGKTCQYLSWLSLNPEIRPALCTVPAPLKLNWQKEVGFWVKSRNKVYVISGKKPKRLPKADIYIINYDILGDAKYSKTKKTWTLKGWVPYLAEFGFQSIVIDECQRIKNEKSQRARACLYLSSQIPRHTALSGTPLKNRAIEIFNPIAFVDKKVFPSFWRFANEYTKVTNNGFGYSFEGVRNSDRLHKILTHTVMIRRLKADVLKELPPKTRAIIPLEISNRKEYTRIYKEFKEWCRGTWEDKAGNIHSNMENPAARMVEIGKLRQATIAGKLDQAVEWIEDFLESDKKLIIFGCHTATLDALQERFKGLCVRLDGGTPANERQDVVERFQTDPGVRLFLGNIIAAGEGITLTAASDVAFIELDWVPSNHIQAEDRAHRIGQTDNVTCWYLVAAGTIEDKLADLIQKKAKVIGQVLDGKAETDKGVFDELFGENEDRESIMEDDSYEYNLTKER